MRVLIDLRPSVLEDLATLAHEDAVVAWDRDGMSDLLASADVWEHHELANVRFLTPAGFGLRGQMTWPCACGARHVVLLLAYFGRSFLRSAVLVQIDNSVRWLRDGPGKAWIGIDCRPVPVVHP